MKNRKQWRTHTAIVGRTIHVWPDEDFIAHDTDTLDCVCYPELELINGTVLVSHSALDGRENYE